MKLYQIDSVILEEDSSRRDMESFAVCYDYLTRADRRYLTGQKSLFWAGVGLLLIGPAYFLLGPIEPILGIAVAVVGLLLMMAMLLRRPRNLRTVRKLYWPVALMRLPSADVDAVVSIDCTKKVWSMEHKILAINPAVLESFIQRLPCTMDDHEAEERNLNTMRAMKDIAKELGMRSSCAPDDYMNKIHGYAKETEVAPKGAIPGMEPSQVEKEASDLSALLETAKGQKVLCEGAAEDLKTRVDAYLNRLDIVHKDEADRMIDSIARFNQEIDGICDFFDPMIESFQGDVKDDLVMLDNFSQRELDIIEERLISDQRYIDIMLDRLDLILRDLERTIKKDGRLRGSPASIEELHRTIRAAKEECINPVEPSISDILKNQKRRPDDKLDMRQLILDTLQGAEGMWRYLEADNGREVAPNVLYFRPAELGQPVHDGGPGHDVQDITKERSDREDPLIANQIKRYDSMAGRARRQLDIIRQRMSDCSNDLGQKNEEYLSVVNDALKRIEAQLIAGKRFIDITDISKDEDQARIRKDIIRLEDQQSFIAQALLDAEAMMVEETARHLRPFAQRGDAFEKERVRLQNEMSSIIASDLAFEKVMEKAVFNCSRPGIYHLPIWLLESSIKGESKRICYGFATLDQKGFMKGKFKDLHLTPDELTQMAGNVNGIDGELLMDIGSSYDAFRTKAKVPWLDAFVVRRGVRAL
ncbi:MAG TPA: hypothetical protein VLH13_00670, partial [Methanomassiliicoccales archaeon]|nr:hypothetical protein [Methanomassiliicoccales archaeon]